MHDFKVHQVLPLRRPLRKEPGVVAFHHLKAAVKGVLNPTGDVAQSLWQQTPLLAGALIDRTRVPILVVFDHHKQHLWPSLIRLDQAQASSARHVSASKAPFLTLIARSS